ncbi:MAG: ATP-grasp domain-containing protein [Planctomycetota bacterium]
MKPLRIVILMHDSLVPPESVEGLSQEEMNPWLMEYDVRQGLRSLGHSVHVLGVGDELLPIRRAIEELQPHLCFNLLTHFLDVGAYSAHVVSYLELLRSPYTGCNPRGLLLAGDKGLSKKVMTYHRIRVPKFSMFRLGRALGRPRKLPFPLIVKSAAEQASMGIAQASIVNDFEALTERVSFVHRTVGTDAIAEEYIPGRELTIGVLGNDRLTALPIRETKFDNLPEGSEPILTSKVKWDLAYQRKVGIRSEPAELPEAVTREIQRAAKRIFRSLELSGYARIDLRLSEDGRPFVLEANPNPDLCAHEDFAVSAASTGLNYEQLLQKIVTLGQSYRPAWMAQ